MDRRSFMLGAAAAVATCGIAPAPRGYLQCCIDEYGGQDLAPLVYTPETLNRIRATIDILRHIPMSGLPADCVFGECPAPRGKTGGTDRSGEVAGTSDWCLN
jgi:hypothetical protein